MREDDDGIQNDLQNGHDSQPSEAFGKAAVDKFARRLSETLRNEENPSRFAPEPPVASPLSSTPDSLSVLEAPPAGARVLWSLSRTGNRLSGTERSANPAECRSVLTRIC